MRWKCTFQIPVFDRSAYFKKLTAELGAALAQGAFEWLNAAVAQVPVWSGASRATFLKLATELRSNVEINIAPNAPNRIGFGRAHSKGEILEKDFSKGVFAFNYETNLAWLVYNEFNNANVTPDPGLLGKLLEPGPYDFLGAGRDAFLRVVNQVGLPNPIPFFKVKIQRVK